MQEYNYIDKLETKELKNIKIAASVHKPLRVIAAFTCIKISDLAERAILAYLANLPEDIEYTYVKEYNGERDETKIKELIQERRKRIKGERK